MWKKIQFVKKIVLAKTKINCKIIFVNAIDAMSPNI